TLRLFNHRLPHEANKSASQVAKGKGPAGPTEETPTPRPKLRSVRELCSAHPGVDDRDYHAIQMSNLPKHALDAPLEIDLAPLTYRDGIWLDGEASTKYIRATQIPKLASDLYTLPSEVLMDGAAKAMVLVSFSSAHLYLSFAFDFDTIARPFSCRVSTIMQPYSTECMMRAESSLQWTTE
ncbi:hypothetical protein BHE74_00058271, partial [Ensete ventricosum]